VFSRFFRTKVFATQRARSTHPALDGTRSTDVRPNSSNVLARPGRHSNPLWAFPLPTIVPPSRRSGAADVLSRVGMDGCEHLLCFRRHG
jgi:hypothetical protein